VSSLERLGWTTFFQEQIGDERAELQVARVVQEQRGLYGVAGDFDGWAEVSGRFRHEAGGAAAFPAVGDWVGVVAPPGADRAVVHRRLERRSKLSRQAAGRAVDEQVVAANVDTVFLVSALTQDVNPNRIERYLTMVWEGGAVPVVLLNKADLCEEASATAAAIRTRLSFVDVLVVSAKTAEGLENLAPYLNPARTIALLGSSGAGKSTLINRLLGRDLLNVGAVRDVDGKGRHTTTSRQLVEMPGGALLIDTPGMRELQPWADESAVDRTFEDVSELSRDCRFADCEHTSEPGCAVLEALAAGTLDGDRLEHYRRLLREAAFEERKRDKGVAAEHKRQWKQMHQAQREMYRRREKP
jgi:ribosome biogenesis GTPase / thiamine phosphate phosphatase